MLWWTIIQLNDSNNCQSTCNIHMPNVFPRILSESLYKQYVNPPLSTKSEKGSTFSGSSSPLCINFLTCFARFFLWLQKLPQTDHDCAVNYHDHSKRTSYKDFANIENGLQFEFLNSNSRNQI